MTVFNSKKFDTSKQPMFFGETAGIARFDVERYPVFSKTTKTMKSFFWNPEEINLSKDQVDFKNLAPHEKHIFTKNISYQILLDSVQQRAPITALLPWVSLPELEAAIIWWSAFEQIHSQSYQWILQNTFPDPTVVFDEIVDDENIVNRANAIIRYYDNFTQLSDKYRAVAGSVELYDLKRALYLAMISVYALEGIRFYVSFACSFAFGQQGKMKGNADIIRLIAKDEAQHLGITTNIIRNWQRKESDPDFTKIAEECEDEVYKILDEVVEQERAWVKYLFKDGSIVGLNEALLVQYLEHVANKRLRTLGLKPRYDGTANPFGWIGSWLDAEDAQVAPQEQDVTSYLVNILDTAVNEDNLIDI